MPFRSRLASCALGMMLLQLTVLLAAPFSACCAPAAATPHQTAPRIAEAEDCCPPGSHPPGQCPLHRSARKDTRSPAAECRIRCAAPEAAAFVAGLIGVLPPPVVVSVPARSLDLAAVRDGSVIVRAAHPDAPPPKLL